MLVIKIHGGIGNQLFQYCFYCFNVSIAGNTVYLDLSFFSDLNKQKYPRENSLFKLLPPNENSNIVSFIPDQNLVSKFIFKKLKIEKYFIFKNIFVFLNNIFGNYFNDKLKPNENILYINKCFPRSIYYDGYWQQFKYVKFGLENINNALKNYSPEIFVKSSENIALHFRRGDYLNISHNGINSIVLDLEYYVQAFAYFKKKYNRLVCEVFSDDFQWCMSNLVILFPDVEFKYNSKNMDDLTSLYFMSKHDNIIVANSTYSLWGFYLSNCSIASVPLSWIQSNQSIGNHLIEYKKFHNLGLLSIYDKNN